MGTSGEPCVAVGLPQETWGWEGEWYSKRKMNESGPGAVVSIQAQAMFIINPVAWGTTDMEIKFRTHIFPYKLDWGTNSYHGRCHLVAYKYLRVILCTVNNAHKSIWRQLKILQFQAILFLVIIFLPHVLTIFWQALNTSTYYSSIRTVIIFTHMSVLSPMLRMSDW